MKSRIFTFAAGLACVALLWSGWSAAAQIGGRGPIVQQSPNGGIVRTVPTRQPGGGLTPTPSPSPAPAPPPNPGWTVSPGGTHTVIGNPATIQPVGAATLEAGDREFKIYTNNVNNNAGYRSGRTPHWDEKGEDELVRFVGGGINQVGSIQDPGVGIFYDWENGMLYNGVIWLTARNQNGETVAVRYVAPPFFIGQTSNFVAAGLTRQLISGAGWTSAVAGFTSFVNASRQRAFGPAVAPAMATAYTERALRINPDLRPVGQFSATTTFNLCITCAKGFLQKDDGIVVPINTFTERVTQIFPTQIVGTVHLEQLVGQIPRKEAGVSEVQIVAFVPNVDPNRYQSLVPVRVLQ